MEYTIDATKMKLGRLSSKVASILIGKNETTFAKNKITPVKVTIKNASKISITDTKKKANTHISYSGYPGGLKIKTFEKVIEKKGYKELVRKAVLGMLPKNKLRTKRLLNLTIEE